MFTQKESQYINPKLSINEEEMSQKTAVVNFTNILRAAFTRADPKSAKKGQAAFCTFEICERKSFM